ncbi:MAG: hypothetical protein FD127_4027, partial [Acidimicrobiaceae bacterium]
MRSALPPYALAELPRAGLGHRL